MEFWDWFAKGSGGPPGFQRLLGRWFVLHATVGGLLSYVVPVNLSTAANAVLLPLVGILIGLAFAWAGNAQTLMQSPEIDDLAEHHDGGFLDYAYTYQLAILVILATVVGWAFAGLEVYDKVWPNETSAGLYFGVKMMLYTLSSLTLRECWHVVLGAQFMLIVQRKIRRASRTKTADKCQPPPPEQ